VNVYIILDEREGPTLIDSGWWLPAGLKRMDASLAELGLARGDIRRVLATHLHRDHYTLGVQLHRETGCELALGAGEQDSLTGLLAGESVVNSWVSILQSAGAPDFGRWNEEPADAGNSGYGVPSRWLSDGEEIATGGHRLNVLATPGHTRGHVSFVEREIGFFFAGDHVLPHITPSIGFETRPAHLPLADYLRSLQRVADLPDLRLLPAHGPITGSTHERVAELLSHHEVRLRTCLDAVDAGALTGFEVASRIGWTRHETLLLELSAMNQVLAIYETVAHLDVLVAQGRLESTADDRVITYAVTGH
jgi:glyoxylase-like metal-dependent hydrolase (beta-lactamase superfamily II)